MHLVNTNTWENHLPFMNKDLPKKKMKGTQLRKKLLKNASEENKRKYKRQQKYCVSYPKQVKRVYCSNLNI